jgi:thiopurine S-methyltransferase
MEIEFWEQRWNNNQIGFHQDSINPYLTFFYGEKGPSAETRNNLKVFVPLCGKSRDMLWLAQNGYQVFGAECSETAVTAFFEENSLNYRSAQNEYGALYQSPAVENGHAAIEIFQGDFFALDANDIEGITDVYDRASLIALPADMRADYASRMAELLATGTRVLLVTMTYDQAEMNGPPFSVTEDHVMALYQDNFDIQKLCFKDIIEDEAGFQQRGLSSLTETVYKLVRK